MKPSSSASISVLRRQLPMPLGERGRRGIEAVLRFCRNEPAVAMQIAHERVEFRGGIALALTHPDHRWRGFYFRLQGTVVAPFGIALQQRIKQRCSVVYGSHATPTAQREQRLGRAWKCARDRAVSLNYRADIAAALRDAHRLAAQVFPARNTAGF